MKVVEGDLGSHERVPPDGSTADSEWIIGQLPEQIARTLTYLSASWMGER